MRGLQSAVGPGTQVPAPLQKDAPVTLVGPEQAAGAHKIAAGRLVHTPFADAPLAMEQAWHADDAHAVSQQ